MYTRFSLFVGLASLFVPFSCGAAEDKPNDTLIELLQGRWEIVAGVNQGRTLSAASVDGTYVTITTNRITTYDRNQQQRYQAVFHVDESAKPIHITMTTLRENVSTDKLNAREQPEETKALGILQFDGKSNWQLCYALPGANRPEKFESPEGSKIMLFTLKKKQTSSLPADKAIGTVDKD